MLRADADLVEFTVAAADLNELMGTASKATPSAPSIVAFSGVRLTATEDAVVAVGSDGETTIAAETDAAVVEEGSALVVPGPVVRFLSKVPATVPVTVTKLNGGDVQLHPENMAPYRFRELMATFPATDPITDGLTTVDPDLFGDGVAAVRVSVGREGVAHCGTDDGALVLTTTDSYRLTQVHLPDCGFVGDGDGIVVGMGALEQVGRLGFSELGLDALGKHLRAGGPGIRMQTRLSDVRFPQVTGPVKSPCAQWVNIERQAMISALERLAAVADTMPVKVDIEGSRMTLVADNLEVGYGSETLRLEQAAMQTFSCLLGRQFLLEALRSHHADVVQFGHSGSTNPVKIVSDEPFKVLSLIMPIRT